MKQRKQQEQRAAFFSVLCVVLFTFGLPLVNAAEFKSVGAQPAVLYDAPSYSGHKVFIAPGGMPVELVLTLDGWSKIRDASGDLSWIETSALTNKRTVMVTAASTGLLADAEPQAALLATLKKGVCLSLLSLTPRAWVKVMHRDGEIGFVKAADVWGD